MTAPGRSYYTSGSDCARSDCRVLPNANCVYGQELIHSLPADPTSSASIKHIWAFPRETNRISHTYIKEAQESSLNRRLIRKEISWQHQ